MRWKLISRWLGNKPPGASKRPMNPRGSRPSRLTSLPNATRGSSVHCRQSLRLQTLRSTRPTEPFLQSISAGFAAELAEAARVFSETLLRGYCVSAALDLGISRRLEELHIPSAGNPAGPLILAHRCYGDSGPFVDLHAAWLDKPQ